MSCRIMFYIWSLILMLPLWSHAQSPEDLMEKGNLAYMEDNFEEALEQYSRIIRMEKVSAPLYHNMGNAWYQKGSIGQAILYYERALRLNPSYEPARHNLRIARSSIINPVEEIPALFIQRWHDGFIALFSADRWAIISIAGLFLMALCIAFFMISRHVWQKKLFFALAAIMLLMGITALYSANRQYHLRYERKEVIVMAEMLHVSSAPAGSGTDLFVAYEGTKAEVINRIDNWLEVRFVDGNIGWVKDDAVEAI